MRRLGSARSARSTIVALLGIALSPLTASGRAGAANGIAPRVAVSPTPNDLGWHSAPVTYRVGFSGSGMARCSGHSEVLYVTGTKISGINVSRDPIPLRECFLEGTSSTSRIESVSRTVQRGDVRVVSRLTVRIDLEAPSATIDAPPAITASPVRIAGSASDGFAGPRLVTLLFRDETGLRASFTVAAACPECGRFAGCGPQRRPPCATTVAWSFEGAVTPGAWHVTPRVEDLAGKAAEGPAASILVV